MQEDLPFESSVSTKVSRGKIRKPFEHRNTFNTEVFTVSIKQMNSYQILEVMLSAKVLMIEVHIVTNVLGGS